MGVLRSCLQLDAEFRWGENRRKLYEALGEADGARFWELLGWAWNVAAWEDGRRAKASKGRLPAISRQDALAFYDNGRDRKGLSSYHSIAGAASVFRPYDEATLQFFPHWSLKEGRYWAIPLGLLGWLVLIFSFAPWRSDTAIGFLPELLPFPPRKPLLDMLAAGRWLEIIITFLPLALAMWIVLVMRTRKSNDGLPWDVLALAGFPLWAAARRLYVWAIVGLTLWAAIIFQIIRYPEVLNKDRLDLNFCLAAFFLSVLHFVAGESGQLWVVYKLIGTVKEANRLGIADPAARSQFMRRYGTRRPPVSDRITRALSFILGVLVIVLVIYGIHHHVTHPRISRYMNTSPNPGIELPGPWNFNQPLPDK